MVTREMASMGSVIGVVRLLGIVGVRSDMRAVVGGNLRLIVDAFRSTNLTPKGMTRVASSVCVGHWVISAQVHKCRVIEIVEGMERGIVLCFCGHVK